MEDNKIHIYFRLKKISDEDLISIYLRKDCDFRQFVFNAIQGFIENKPYKINALTYPPGVTLKESYRVHICVTQSINSEIYELLCNIKDEYRSSFVKNLLKKAVIGYPEENIFKAGYKRKNMTEAHASVVNFSVQPCPKSNNRTKKNETAAYTDEEHPLKKKNNAAALEKTGYNQVKNNGFSSKEPFNATNTVVFKEEVIPRQKEMHTSESQPQNSSFGFGDEGFDDLGVMDNQNSSEEMDIADIMANLMGQFHNKNS